MYRLTRFLSKPFNVLHSSLIVVLLVLALVGFVRILPALIRVPGQVDFAAYYLAAKILNTGGSLYDQEALRNAGNISGITSYALYIYLPFLAIVFRPLALLPYPFAATVWFLLNLGLAIFSMILLGRKFQLSTYAIVLLVCGYLILPSTYDTLLLGQFAIFINTLLVMILILTSLPESSRNKDVIAGVLLGIAVIIKVYLGVIGLVFLLHRRFYVIASMGITVLTLLILSILLEGWNSTWQWFSVVLPSISGGSAFPVNQSFWGVTQRFFTPHTFSIPILTADNYVSVQLSPIINAPAIGKVVNYLGVIIIALASGVLILRFAKKGEFLLSLSVGITLMLLISPITWDSYLVHLVIPLFVVTERCNTPWCRTTVWIVCLLLVLQRYWRFLLLYVSSPLLMMFGFMAVVIVWFILFRIGHRKNQIGFVQM